jgi:hypothetical protein
MKKVDKKVDKKVLHAQESKGKNRINQMLKKLKKYKTDSNHAKMAQMLLDGGLEHRPEIGLAHGASVVFQQFDKLGENRPSFGTYTIYNNFLKF